MTITMTIEQYNNIRRLADFAKWYIEEHSGDVNFQQWEEDKQDVDAGLQALNEVDQQLQFS